MKNNKKIHETWGDKNVYVNICLIDPPCNYNSNNNNSNNNT